MDGPRFDTLIKRLSTTPVTRSTALRGLAISTAVLAGMGLRDEEAGADKGETKRKWCHRGDDLTILGKTKTLTKDQIKQHKRKHAADYKGKCTAARIVAPSGGSGGSGQDTPPVCTANHCQNPPAVCGTGGAGGTCVCFARATDGGFFCGNQTTAACFSSDCTQSGTGCAPGLVCAKDTFVGSGSCCIAGFNWACVQPC